MSDGNAGCNFHGIYFGFPFLKLIFSLFFFESFYLYLKDHKTEINQKPERNGSRALNPFYSSFVHPNSRKREFALGLIIQQKYQCTGTGLESWNSRIPIPTFIFDSFLPHAWPLEDSMLCFPQVCRAGHGSAFPGMGAGVGKAPAGQPRLQAGGRGAGNLGKVPSNSGYSMIL